MKNIIKIQNKSELFGGETTKEKPKEFFGRFIYDGEVSILFGDSCTGKSVLANDMAFFVSGGGHDWNGFKSPNVPSLYIDLEMSTRQFKNRYGNARDYIPDTYNRAIVDTSGLKDDDILPEVKKLITGMQASTNPPKFIIVDNITNGFGSVVNATKMKKLIFEFKNLKEKFGLTILLIAHCPKRKKWSPLTNNDIGGSSNLLNFVDSCFAIGMSKCGGKYRYIKQIKTREDSGLKEVLSVRMDNEPYLSFRPLGFHQEEQHLADGGLFFFEKEITPDMEAVMASMLLDNKTTVEEIADTVGLSTEEVIKYIEMNQY